MRSTRAASACISANGVHSSTSRSRRTSKHKVRCGYRCAIVFASVTPGSMGRAARDADARGRELVLHASDERLGGERSALRIVRDQIHLGSQRPALDPTGLVLLAQALDDALVDRDVEAARRVAVHHQRETAALEHARAGGLDELAVGAVAREQELEVARIAHPGVHAGRHLAPAGALRLRRGVDHAVAVDEGARDQRAQHDGRATRVGRDDELGDAQRELGRADVGVDEEEVAQVGREVPGERGAQRIEVLRARRAVGDLEEQRRLASSCGAADERELTHVGDRAPGCVGHAREIVRAARFPSMRSRATLRA